MMASAAKTVFQASDLNQHGRAVLDAARAGEARVRDKDGMSLLVLPERRVHAWLTVVHAAANLATLQSSLARQQESLAIQDYGEWTWLRSLDGEDLGEFVREMGEAVIVCAREESPSKIEETLHAWRTTAQELEDPTRRAILLGELREEDYIEVGRPEQPQAANE